MNWRDNSLRPTAWLSVFLSLAACQTISDIDTTVGPDTDRIGVNYVEVSLPAELVQIDSFASTNTGRLLTGRMVDSELGTITATSYTRMVLQTADPVVKADSEFDSLILYWNVTYLATEQSVVADQEFFVHRLADGTEFSRDSTYYTQSSLPIGDMLGSISITLPQGLEDTVLAIHLDAAWGNELLQAMINREPPFKNNNEFNKVYPGLAFVSGAGNEAILGVNVVDGTTSRLSLFFSSPGDSLAKEYEISISGANTTGFSQVETANDGLATSGLAETYQPVDANGRIICTAGSRYAALLDLDVLRAYFDTLSPNLINYAEIIIDGIENPDGGNLPVGVRFYLTEEDGRFIPALEADSVVTRINFPKGIYDPSAPQNPQRRADIVYFEPNFNDSTNYFRGPITPFLQSVADGTIVESRLLLLPVGFGGSVRTLKLDESDLKFRFYYTSPED